MEACLESALSVISKHRFESNYARGWLRWMILLAFTLGPLQNPAHGQGAGLSIGNYRVVNSIRVGRLEDEFTVRADITNSGADAHSVLARVTSTSSSTTIVLPSLSFGDVAAGTTKTSANTFSIRQNRVATFDPGALPSCRAAPKSSRASSASAPARVLRCGAAYPRAHLQLRRHRLGKLVIEGIPAGVIDHHNGETRHVAKMRRRAFLSKFFRDGPRSWRWRGIER